MEIIVPPELEELILCSCCHLPFNDTDALPKLFSCRHYFCLKCVNSILLKGNELYCVHCWKRTELPPGSDKKSDLLPTYNAILYLSKNFSILTSKTKPPDIQQQQSNSLGSDGAGAGSTSTKQSQSQSQYQPSSSSSSNSVNNSNGGGGNNNIHNGINIINNSTAVSSSSSSSNQHILNGGGNGQQFKKGENCMTHAMPNTLWCTACMLMICRACAGSEDHRNHNVKSQIEAKEFIFIELSHEIITMQSTLNEVHCLVMKQRDFLLKILESCTALKTQIETELINHIPTLEITEIRENIGKAKLYLEMLEQSSSSPADALKLYSTLSSEKQHLQSKYQEMYLQCKLDDLIRHYGVLFDFELIKQALAQLHNTNGETYCTLNGGLVNQNPILLLANYCISQLYSRHFITNKHLQYINNTTNHNNYHSQYLQLQQLHVPIQQPMGIYPANHEGLLTTVKTYAADITTTNSPQSIQQHPSILHYQPQPHQPQPHQPQPHQHLHQSGGNGFHNHLHTNLAVTTSTTIPTTIPPADNKIIVGTTNVSTIIKNPTIIHRASNGGTATNQTGVTYISNELNGISVPATLNLMQNHLKSQTQLKTGQQLTATTTATTATATTAAAGAARATSVAARAASVAARATSARATSVAAGATATVNNSITTNLLCQPSNLKYPIYFLNMEMNGQACGRILIEVRNDVAPKMAKNFDALATGEFGFGYKGCQIFQCWENESIITGDFELNNGRGGRSVFEDGFFMPDDTKILASRGSVGMRRSQKRHDNLGLVGSQFRIILREMRGFTGIFAFVIEGLDLIEKISQTGDSAGKPQSNVVIANCGKYQ